MIESSGWGGQPTGMSNPDPRARFGQLQQRPQPTQPYSGGYNFGGSQPRQPYGYGGPQQLRQGLQQQTPQYQQNMAAGYDIEKWAGLSPEMRAKYRAGGGGPPQRSFEPVQRNPEGGYMPVPQQGFGGPNAAPIGRPQGVGGAGFRAQIEPGAYNIPPITPPAAPPAQPQPAPAAPVQSAPVQPPAPQFTATQPGADYMALRQAETERNAETERQQRLHAQAERRREAVPYQPNIENFDSMNFPSYIKDKLRGQNEETARYILQGYGYL